MTEPSRHDHPARFGRFQVIAPLAGGGMGLVYLAQDDGGRPAVVKTIRSELAADPSYRARFRNEAQAARRVRSNLVARVWDCDASSDPPWIALEKIDGPTLREVVATGQVMDEVALSAFAADLAEGIHAFYDQGMAHGDLTPSNVVIQDGNRLKILDLGLARPTADETATGDLPAMGTPYWLAPEVAAGFAPDNLSDVNQWGKLVLFAGTGYPHAGPGNIRDSLAQLSSPLQLIVERCLSAVPDLRPQPEELWNQTRQRRLSGSAPPVLELSTRRIFTQPDSETTVTATAGNRSAASEDYRFDVLGPLRDWAFVRPSTATIGAGKETAVSVGFRLPAGSPVEPGDWPFAVRCAAKRDDTRATVAEGTLAVRPVSGLHLQLLTASSQGRWIGRYAFAVRSSGNTTVRVRLTTAQPGDELSFAISPPALEVDPGETVSGLVKVRTRRPSLFGTPAERRFQITASTDSDLLPSQDPGAISEGASFRQVPVLGRGPVGVLAVGLFLAALVVVIVFLFD